MHIETQNVSATKILVFLFAVLLLIGSVSAITIQKLRDSKEEQLKVSAVTAEKQGKSLQLDSFKPSPTPVPTIIPTNGVAPPVYESEQPSQGEAAPPPSQDSCVVEGVGPNCCEGVDLVTPQEGISVGGQDLCDSKPVIYLYPEKKTLVDVILNFPGFVSKSIPKYPAGGWKNIEAYPDGAFVYQGQRYQELYYESVVKRVVDNPKNGYLVMPSEYQQTLEMLGTRLGLNKKENKEMVSYWTERLSKVKTPYLFMSFYSPEEKVKVDGVEILPSPDTFIEFILYFRPEKSFKVVHTPVFPSIPKRIGFTAVEWGGILDQ